MKTLKALTLIAAIVIAISTFAINKAMDNEKIIDQGYATGAIATDFKLKNIDDKEVSLMDYKDASQVSEPFVVNAVHALLQGEKIKITQTKAIGCSIKR